MKIQFEIRGVSVVHHGTIADALMRGLGKHPLDGTSNRILDALRLKTNTAEEEELSEVLREPLWKECDGCEIYRRTCAFVSIEEEMTEYEFRQKLFSIDREHHPAGIGEAMSYLSVLGKEGVEVDFVFHLGCFILGIDFHSKVLSGTTPQRFMEKSQTLVGKRLLTRTNGGSELVVFYPATKLKRNYNIVVVKEEKGE